MHHANEMDPLAVLLEDAFNERNTAPRDLHVVAHQGLSCFNVTEENGGDGDDADPDPNKNCDNGMPGVEPRAQVNLQEWTA